MCGLFGYCSLHKKGSALPERGNAARDAMHHRGPDQSGEWSDDRIYMGQRRLSIMDLSDAGRQPMFGADGKVVLIANGEIYNFRPLREELEGLGAVFTSWSDSEVLLHGYIHWGVDVLLEKIDGMYAFAIYDQRTKEIICVRDRAGIKPLHYALVGGEFVFASELKAIVSLLGRGNLEHDNTAAYDFLTYGYIPAPKTAYKNVFKLPPASILRFHTETQILSVSRYWHLPVKDRQDSDDMLAAELRALLEKSVNEQMVADVPVGFFLSGGMDSSIVTGLASTMTDQVKTFTIGFGEEGFDETAYAQIVASAFKTDHHEKIISHALDIPFVQWLCDLYDEPFASSSALPTWYVSQLARKHVTVVLTGDGGDELFGGYKWYQDDRYKVLMARFLAALPRWIWALPLPRKKGLKRYADIASGGADNLVIYNDLYFTKLSRKARQSYRIKLGIPDGYDDMWFFRQFDRPDLPWRKRRQYLDFHTFMPESVLTKVDRASMAHSIETRVPFLSRELMEFAFSLPEQFLYKDGALKGGLKSAFRDLLPRKILARNKQGFSVPWKKWQTNMVNGDRSLQEAVWQEFYDKK